MYDLILKNGTIVSKNGIKKLDILIREKKIVGFKEKFEGESKRIINCENKYILPGVIDVHVHFRVPGGEEKEDWHTGSAAAVSAGVTTVLDMPNNSPSITSFQLLQKKRDLISGKSLVNYGLYVGATPTNCEELIKIAGIPAIKVYAGSSTGDLLVSQKDDLENLFSKAGNKLLCVHAEDESLIRRNSGKYKGIRYPKVHSEIRSNECAYQSARMVVHLAKKYESRLHICHLSTKEEVELMRKFKSDKLSCEATPHHLFLDVSHYDKLGNFGKMNPPLRSQEDKEALWEGLREGLIPIVATDHAPHLKEEKEKDYWEAPSGVPGVETLLPLMLDAVNHGSFTLEKLVEITSYNPAKIFQIQSKGEIEEDFDADLVVCDMNLSKKVENKNLYTKCGWSPFDGFELLGWPVLTVVNGVVGFENGRVREECRGEEVIVG